MYDEDVEKTVLYYLIFEKEDRAEWIYLSRQDLPALLVCPYFPFLSSLKKFLISSGLPQDIFPSVHLPVTHDGPAFLKIFGAISLTYRSI